jgi:hypothetical protein
MVAIVTHVDDMDYAADPDRKVPADVTVRFAFEGVSYRIDLTNAHADEFRKDMAPYVKVADLDDGDPAPAGKKRSHAVSAGDTPLKRAKRHRMRMRAFADSRADLGRASYLTDGGNHQYTDRLEKAYAAYVAEHGEYPLPGEPGGGAL